jgi:putative ABC transport system substrate-binding protein
MLRREFIALLSGAATAWPFAATAQQVPLIGFISPGDPAILRQQLLAFRDGLGQVGYIEKQNIEVEYHFAEGKFNRLPELAMNLARRQPAAIVVTSVPGVLAVKQVTSSIPIVFSIGADPIASGIVTSLNRPSGNITGVYQFTTGLEAKRLGLLHEVVPKATAIAVLINPSFPSSGEQLKDVNDAATRLGVRLVVERANSESDFDAAFSAFVRQGATGLLVCASPFFNNRRQQLVLLAARHGLPAIYEWRDFADAGGLMTYGTSLGDAFRQAGVYAGRILNGEKPSDLPVVQATRFEFVINLNTAKALRLEVPATLSAHADEVIE